MGAEVGRPDLRYEVAEHVAYCFSCIGRALDPEECAAVLLTEVFELPNSEAARALGLSESTFRHRLSSGRKQMMTAFDGLCALVSKRGACHQCATLRDIYPSERRGHEVPALGDVDDPAEDPEARFKRRLAIVRSADVTDGSTAGVHAVMLRFIAQKLEAP
jgi:RNA polymerase sigma-70 factor (ECF subfamily)